MPKFLYLISFVGSLNILIAFWLRGVWSFFPLVFTFMVLPCLELFLRPDARNLAVDEEDRQKNQTYFDWILWLSLPLQYLLLAWYLKLMSSANLSFLEQLGLTLSMGLSCGVLGINAAHEIGHRNTPHEQVMARLLLMTAWYWHFTIEHNKGHHKNVSTPEDPASARLNESVFTFYLRSIFGSIRSAWHIETLNARREGHSIWSWRNEMVLALIVQLSFTLAIFFVFGSTATLGFLGAAIVGVLLLETVNYIEHYGLSRQELAPGRFEKVQPYHSWNADHPISRVFLFNLSRHSDHHYNAARKYQILRHHNDSLQLPTGYPGMMLLALIPPLWFRIMNQRIPR